MNGLGLGHGLGVIVNSTKALIIGINGINDTININKKENSAMTTNYVEDSTRGSSLINPVNYKGDVLVQVWLDSRLLATMVKWLDSEGTVPRYMSHVVRFPLEALAQNLVDNNEVEMVEETMNARDMLENRFGVKLNRGNKGTKNVIHNQLLTDRRIKTRQEEFSRLKGALPAMIENARRNKDSPAARRAREFNEKVAKGEITRPDNADEYESLSVVRNAPIVEDNECLVKEKMTDDEFKAMEERRRKEDKERAEAERLANEEFIRQWKERKKGEDGK